MKKNRYLLVILLVCLPLLAAAKDGGTFGVGDKTFLLNGQPFVVKAAEVHYPRIPREYWEHRIRMCKALGMNTLCLYVFWNIHEPQQDAFDFTGQNDVAAFCRLAQKNGMYVIVRPGPYVCAEWEMGGLPWWLLKKKDIRLREQDHYFMERVKIFEQKVGEQLAPLTIQNGGPIIMIQVENEYGSYGEDKAYVSAIRDCLRGIYGNQIALFQCDWASNFEKNGLDDLVWTMNFGTGANIDQQFRRLRELRPHTPLMCSEFWSGWFDKWGARHETRPAEKMVAGMDEMLSKGISFSLYMTHGGTSFGHWAGANSPGFAPDVTSYDYDAPINEYGQPTEKYYELREMMQKYSDKKLPAVPKPVASLISVPRFELTEFAPLMNSMENLNFDSTTEGVDVGPLRTFEEMNLGWGCMLYMAQLPETKGESQLTLDAHDYAQVFVDNQFVGKTDRVKNEHTVTLPPLPKGGLLKILVEGMGRINFGRAIKDHKGLVAAPVITIADNQMETSWKPLRWIQIPIPDTFETALAALNKTDKKPTIELGMGRGYYRGYFTLKKTGDTFLNMERFGKGQVWVNGHALGRFWNIGPQQTLYLPGCWLKKGRNEVVVLDIIGPEGEATCFAQDHPELDKLNLQTVRDKGAKLDLKDFQLVAEGELKPGNGWQTIDFKGFVEARKVAIVCESAHDGGPVAAIAELHLQDTKGKRISRELWKVGYVDSEDTQNGNLTADKTYDLQESTYWQTAPGVKFPHALVLSLGQSERISALDYLPRAEAGAPGSVRKYKVYVSTKEK